MFFFWWMKCRLEDGVFETPKINSHILKLFWKCANSPSSWDLDGEIVIVSVECEATFSSLLA